MFKFFLSQPEGDFFIGMKRILTVCTLLCASSFVYGQSENIHGQLRFGHLTIDDGLTNNRVRALAQDEFGFIWIGTKTGINLYDGRDATKYEFYYVDDTLRKPFQELRVGYSDSRGELWFGGMMGVVKYNRSKDRFELVRFRDKDSGCYDMDEDHGGSMWFTQNDGVIRYDPENGKLETYLNEPGDSNSLPVGATQKVLIDYLDNVWIGTDRDGLVYFDRSANTFDHFVNEGNEGDLAENYVERIYEDPDHTIWVSHNNQGISKYNPGTKSFKHLFPDPSVKESGRVRDLLVDPKGNFWIGSMAGLYLLNKGTETFKKYASIDHPKSRLSHNSIQVMLLDKQQGLWLGTFAGGVSFTNLNTSGFIHYSYSPIPNDYFLNDKNIYSIAIDGNNDLWIGTENGGLNYLDRRTGKFNYFKRDLNNRNALQSNNIKSICIDDSNEEIWVGTYRGGLAHLDLSSKRITNFLPNSRDPFAIHNNEVYNLKQDPIDPQLLWVGTNQGLTVFNKKSRRFYQTDEEYFGVPKVSESLKEKRIYDIEVADQSVVIASVGVTLYDRTTGKLTQIDEIEGITLGQVPFLMVDKKKAIWFYSDSHLFRITLDGERAAFGTGEGLPQVDFFSAHDDYYGDVWISSNHGLYRFSGLVASQDTLSYQVYNKSDNLQSQEFIYGSSAQGSDGELFFGGINGLNSFYPKDVKRNQFKPFVHISALVIDGNKVMPGQKAYGSDLLSKPMLSTDSITIGHNIKTLALELNSLHYSASSSNQLSYILENYDDQWTKLAGSEGTVTYTNLPAGDYVFKVKGANGDGVWADEVRSLNIEVLPAWWETWWFRVLVLVLVVFGIYYFIRSRIKGQRIQHKLLEEKVSTATEQISVQNKELQLQSRKLEEAIQETNNIIAESVDSGDFSVRIDLEGKTGVWLDLGESINKLFDSILKPFSDINDVVDAMAQGDLSKRMSLESRGDILSLSQNLNHALDNLGELLLGVIQQVEYIGQETTEMMHKTNMMNSSTEEIASAIAEMSQGAHAQVTKVDEASGRVDSILTISGEIATEAEHINQEASKGVSQSDYGKKLIEGVGNAMQTILAFSAQSSEAIYALSERSNDISRVMGIIRDIASQTNLLALNAAIEASKAGESGRGFAVVAEEVRKLAESSEESSSEIEKLISEVQKSTISTTDLISQMTDSVKKGDSASADAIKSFIEISSSYEKTLSLSEKIVDSTRRQTEEVGGVVKVSENIVTIAEETAAGTEEIAASSAQLSDGMMSTTDRSKQIAEIVDELKEKVRKFYLGKRITE